MVEQGIMVRAVEEVGDSVPRTLMGGHSEKSEIKYLERHGCS